jgi:hypothetical protein|tara:strand:- start:84176 stop:84358 length:183 start_codon:yes stop_codon:yes gene_type:complete
MAPDTLAINVTKPVMLGPEATDLYGWYRAFVEPFLEAYFFLFKGESHFISPYFLEHIADK